MVALYIPNVKLTYGAITTAECCAVDSVEWPCKLKSKLMSLQALEITEGIHSQVENVRQSTNESLTPRTRALSFSSAVFHAESRIPVTLYVRKKTRRAQIWTHRPHLKADGLYYGNHVFLSLILLCKTFPRNTTPEMLDKNKTLD